MSDDLTPEQEAEVVEFVNSLEEKPVEDKVKEAIEKFRETSVALLHAFMYLEETLKTAAQLCVDLAADLEDKQTPEGETNVD